MLWRKDKTINWGRADPISQEAEKCVHAPGFKGPVLGVGWVKTEETQADAANKDLRCIYAGTLTVFPRPQETN